MSDAVKKAAMALLCMQRHSWEQGVAIQAFLELGGDWDDTVFAMAKEAAYRRTADGRPAMMGDGEGSTDPCSVGEAMLYAAEKTGDAELLGACRALENWTINTAPRNGEGILYHLKDRPQFWVDSMYMLPPYLAAIDRFDEALHQIDGYWDALHDEETGLMSHMWDDAAKTFPRKAFWGVGNGWTTAGFARVIDMLPPEMAVQRKKLEERAVGLIDSLLRHKRPDGLFHDVVDDAETFVEVNLSQMLAYSIFRGVKSGWLGEEYLSPAEEMRAAARAKQDRFGLIQDVCGAPHFDKPGVAPEGQAFFLLLESAAAKLGK